MSVSSQTPGRLFDWDTSLGFLPTDHTAAVLADAVWSSRAFYGGPSGPNHGSPRGLLDIDGCGVHWVRTPMGNGA